MKDLRSKIHAQGLSGPIGLRERHVDVRDFNDGREFDGYALKEIQIVTELYSQEAIDKLIDMLHTIKPCLKP